MIRKIHLSSFKCFEDQNILFAPITVLTGLNNCGKSSVLQALRICQEKQIPDGLGEARDLKCQSSVDFPEIKIDFSNGDSIDCSFSASGIKCPSTNAAFTHLQYISADRLGPQVSLPYKNNVKHVGKQGENVYAVLNQYRDQSGVPPKLRHESLQEAGSIFEQVRAWLKIISPSTAFDFQIYSEADMGTAHFGDFRPTNVGFGLSYTLPIIVSVLVNAAISQSGQDMILLIENPEAHLHPRGQTALGNFLALASQCGVQCIIETHSEHILNGIRIAVKEGQLPPDHAIFHYFEKKPGMETTNVESIFTDKNGMLDKWPDGFFDENERAMMRLL